MNMVVPSWKDILNHPLLAVLFFVIASIAGRDDANAKQLRISAMVSFAAYIVGTRQHWDYFGQWMFITICGVIAWGLLEEKA
jgi:hypothetical protein